MALLRCTHTDIASARPEGAKEAVTNGTGKPVPYKVRRKICVKARQILHTGNPSVIAEAMPAAESQPSATPKL